MKILIIGQAPPAVKQTVPYDTTMLYEILEWVGITKEQAQDMFEFEAVSNVFPGFKEGGGHSLPTQIVMEKHWEDTLETKVQAADKVILLGRVAQSFFHSRPKTWSCDLKVLEMMHPSRLNYNRFINGKIEITQQLKNFI